MPDTNNESSFEWTKNDAHPACKPGAVVEESSALLRLVTHAIAIDEDSTIEQCAAAWTKINAFVAIANSAKKQLAERIIANMDANGIERLPCGQTYCYIGKPKDTRCTDVGATVDLILEQHSLEDLKACLVSQPFKHGATRKLLGETNLFETTERKTLKEGTADGRQLISVNPDFVEANHGD